MNKLRIYASVIALFLGVASIPASAQCLATVYNSSTGKFDCLAFGYDQVTKILAFPTTSIVALQSEIIGPNTIAAGANQLPDAASHTGELRRVTDALDASDCTSGGGTAGALCVSNGANWASMGGGGGGSGTVTSSGSPANHQLALFTSGTNIKGLAVGSTDKPLVGVSASDPAFSRLILTNPATAATLTIADNKTVTVNNTMTLAGTDAQTYTFPSTSAAVARTDAANTFTGVQTMTSPAITTPAITGVSTGSGVATAATASTLALRNASGEVIAANTVATGLTPVATTRTVAGHALSADVTVSASDVGLGSVTNDVQAKASIHPNTAPASGQILVGNTGGTAYAPVALSGDCTMVFTGAITCTKLNNVAVSASSSASTIVQRNASSEVIAANTVATGKTPMATDTSVVIAQLPGYFTGGGTAQAQTVSPTPAITSLSAGLSLCFLPAAANTAAAPTLTVNSLTATTITKYGTVALVANDIITTVPACVVYDGTRFQLLNPLFFPAAMITGGTSGTVTSSSSPAIHQLSVFTTGTDIKGVAVGATDKPLVGVTSSDPVYSKLTLTNPATSATLTIADGASLITSGAFAATITATATTNSTLPAGTHSLAPLDSPSFTTPALGTPSSGVVTNLTGTLTNIVYDAEGTGNTLTIPFTTWLPAAGCFGATPSSFWDLQVSTPAVATCVTGTNSQKGILAFADTTGGFSAQTEYLLPSDWTGAIDARIIWNTPATSGNVKWSLSTMCTSVSAAETDDAAFDTASTVTTAAPGTTLRLQTSTITGLTASQCGAGEYLHLKLFRDGNDGSDTIANTANLLGVELKLRRAL